MWFFRGPKAGTPEYLWEKYCIATKKSPDVPPPAWAFGPESFADEGAQLVLSGRKTATSSLYELYELEGERAPQVGDQSILLDGQGRARCIIEHTAVDIVPFAQVSAEHAAAEGEGDFSLEYWRGVHREVFTQWLAEVGRELRDDTPVLCESFKVIFRLED